MHSKWKMQITQRREGWQSAISVRIRKHMLHCNWPIESDSLMIASLKLNSIIHLLVDIWHSQGHIHGRGKMGLIYIYDYILLVEGGGQSAINTQTQKHATLTNRIWFIHDYILLEGGGQSAINTQIQKHATLTGGNWQKWKRVFLTCPCHKIYRDEAVGLKSCKYTWKITIFVKMWNLGQYRENLIFCQ